MGFLTFSDGSEILWNSRIGVRPLSDLAVHDVGRLYAAAVFEERGGHTLLGRLGNAESVASAMRRRGAAFAQKIPPSQAGSFMLWSCAQNAPIGLHLAWDHAETPRILTGEPLLAPHDAIVDALTSVGKSKGLLPTGKTNDVLYAAMLCLDPRLMAKEGLSREDQNSLVAWVMGTYHRQAFEAGYTSVLMFFAHAALQTAAPVLVAGLENRGIGANMFKVPYAEMHHVGPLADLNGGAVALVNRLGPTTFDAWIGAVLEARKLEAQLKAKL